MIVRKVWWRLNHPETGGVATDHKVGNVGEIFVECEPAIGPYSSDHWRDLLTAIGQSPEFEVARLSFRESDVRGG